MKVALDVPAVDDDVGGAAANAAPLSPRAGAGAGPSRARGIPRGFPHAASAFR